MIKKTFSILLFIFSSFSLYGNDVKAKVDSLNLIAWEIHLDSSLQSINFVKRALALSDSINYLEGMSTSNNFLGIFYFKKGIYSLAEHYFLSAIDVRKKLNYKEGEAYVYGNLCGLKYEEGDFPACISYGFKALDIYKKLGVKNDEPSIFLNLAIAHQNTNDTKDAHKYYEKALKVAHEKKDTYNIGLTNYNWATLHLDTKEYEIAEKYYKLSLPLFILMEEKAYESDSYSGLAMVASKEKEYLKAKHFLDKSISINKILNDSLRLFYNYYEQSEININQERYSIALKNLNIAENFLGQNKRFDFNEILNRRYSIIYQKLNNFRKSYFHLKKAEIFKDSLFSIAKDKNIARLQKQNAEREAAEAEKAKAEEELKNQKLTQSLLLAGILSLGLLFGLYVINQRRIQKSRELTDFKDQQERVIDQRIIGATQEIRKELARNLHNHVATPLTHIKRFIEPIYQQLSFDPEWQANLMQALQIADKAHVVSRDISYQLKPEKIDWVDRIKISMVALEKNKTMRTNLEAKGLTDIAFTKIEGEKISSIIGNLLSNVDKHSKATEVKVNITQNYRHLNIEVVDNGVGFKPQEDSGIGLESIYAGVNELNGKIAIESTKDEGAFIKIDIPITQG